MRMALQLKLNLNLILYKLIEAYMSTIDSRPLFDFECLSDSKLPEKILARYCFENESVKIPNTDLELAVEQDYWLFCDVEKTNLYILSHELFVKTYVPINRKTSAYCDFIQDTIFNEIEMTAVVLEAEDLFQHSDLSEEIEFAHWFGLQGEIYLNDNKKPCLNLAHTVDIKPLKLKDRVLIAWNILTNKNFKFDKVSMDWD